MNGTSGDESFVWAIVGTKRDLSDIEVNRDETRLLRNKVGTNLSFYVSSKTGDNVDHALEKIIAAVHSRKTSSNSALARSFKLDEKDIRKTSCC